MSDVGVTEEEAKGIVYGTCNGLAFLHAQGLVHRDIKPAVSLLFGRLRIDRRC